LLLGYAVSAAATTSNNHDVLLIAVARWFLCEFPSRDLLLILAHHWSCPMTAQHDSPVSLSVSRNDSAQVGFFNARSRR